MSEILFLVESSPEGGYTARALGHSIFTETDDLAGLHANVRDAVWCHFDNDQTNSFSLLEMNENQYKGPSCP